MALMVERSSFGNVIPVPQALRKPPGRTRSGYSQAEREYQPLVLNCGCYTFKISNR